MDIFGARRITWECSGGNNEIARNLAYWMRGRAEREDRRMDFNLPINVSPLEYNNTRFHKHDINDAARK